MAPEPVTDTCTIEAIRRAALIDQRGVSVRAGVCEHRGFAGIQAACERFVQGCDIGLRDDGKCLRLRKVLNDGACGADSSPGAG